MKNILIVGLTFAVTCGPAALVSAQDRAPLDRAGWTGITSPREVIAARQALMIEIERLMRPIDAYIVDGDDGQAVVEAARSLAAMLLSVPHLFPPTTDVYDPQAEIPETLALPELWSDFATFSAMASSAAAAAETLAEATGGEALRSASTNLRSSCDACHAVFMRPYVSGEVTQEDLEFDFDSLFEDD